VWSFGVGASYPTLKAPLIDRFIPWTLELLRGPMRTRNMEGRNNLRVNSYGEYFVVVEDFLDSGAKSDTGEGEFAKGYQPFTSESTTL
jgi:hypothetical protein